METNKGCDEFSEIVAMCRCRVKILMRNTIKNMKRNCMQAATCTKYQRGHKELICIALHCMDCMDISISILDRRFRSSVAPAH